MKNSIYYRKFTALLPKNGFLKKIVTFLVRLERPFSHLKKSLKLTLLLTSFLLFLFLSVFSYSLYRIYNDVVQKRVDVQNRAFYWENILKRHPEYPDAYYLLAWNLYILNEKDKAFVLLNQALVLDPNFKQAQDFRNKLIEGK